jgi:hypothetical protein
MLKITDSSLSGWLCVHVNFVPGLLHPVLVVVVDDADVYGLLHRVLVLWLMMQMLMAATCCLHLQGGGNIYC